MSAENIITIRGLRNSFGEQIIHENLDLDVRRGEILGVVGGSGTGKSVLMRSIIGLQTPDEGEVEVLGENMIGREEDEAKNIRRRWGVMFQNGALFSTLTVAENVEVPIREYFPFIESRFWTRLPATRSLCQVCRQMRARNIRQSFPAACASALASPVPWRSIPNYFFSTSRLPGLIRSVRPHSTS